MKKFYESPDAQVVDLAAMEKIALIDNDGEPVPGGDQSVVPGQPPESD